MDVIVYNNRQMDNFFKLKIFIHPLDILKMSWLNVKIHSLKFNKYRLDGTNEIEC